MKRILLTFLSGLMICGCLESSRARAVTEVSQKEVTVSNKEWADFTDPAKAAKAKAVLRVKFLKSLGADKYGWDLVEVLHVIKNDSSFDFPKQLKIAYYSWEPGIPPGECTVYLEPYAEGDKGDKSLWKLLKGSGKQGVSHKK